MKNDDSATQYEEPGGVFYPDIDTILFRREKEVEGERKMEYLVKYKEYSYLHVEWLEEQDIVSTKSGKNKLNRFIKTFEKKLLEQVVFLSEGLSLKVLGWGRILTRKMTGSLIQPTLR